MDRSTGSPSHRMEATIASGSDDDYVCCRSRFGRDDRPSLHLGDDVLSVDIIGWEFLAAGAKDDSSVWDLSDLQAPLFTIAAHRGWVMSSPSEPRWHGAGNERVWRSHTTLGYADRLAAPAAGRARVMDGVAFNPRGDLLASAATDGFVRFWVPASGRRSGKPVAIHGDPNRMAFNPEGDTMAVALFDGSIQLIDLEERRTIGAPSAVIATSCTASRSRPMDACSPRAVQTVPSCFGTWRTVSRSELPSKPTLRRSILRSRPTGPCWLRWPRRLVSSGTWSSFRSWDTSSGVSTLDISQDGHRIVQAAGTDRENLGRGGSHRGRTGHPDAKPGDERGVERRRGNHRLRSCGQKYPDLGDRSQDRPREHDPAHQGYVPVRGPPDGTVVAPQGRRNIQLGHDWGT